MSPKRRSHRGVRKRDKRHPGAPTRRKKKTRPVKRPATRVRAKSARRPKRAPQKTARPQSTFRTSSKTELRKQLRAKRAQLSQDAQRRAARGAMVHVISTRLFRASRRIACYLPTDGEIDPSRIIERVWRAGKTAYLPVLSRLPHDRLWFAPAAPGMELVPNRYGILEPRVPARELVRAEQLDLILLPLVAFDADGNRLGRGVGFYDKSLAFLRGRRFLRKPHLLGLAHDFQRVPSLPTDPWDVPLDGIVTERAVYYAGL